MADNASFLNLWPTLIMRDEISGSTKVNQVLKDELLRRDQQRQDMTTNYRDENLFEVDHPALQWLTECVNHAVVRYAKEAGINYAFDWHLQGWANVNRFGDYHNLHNHPHAWLSGTYYVSVPQTLADLPGRADRNPGAISFFDPRPQANMNAIRNDGQIDPEFRILPTGGEILLWPAFLHHLVHPNLSHDERISISFNVVLRQSSNLLPDQ